MPAAKKWRRGPEKILKVLTVCLAIISARYTLCYLQGIFVREKKVFARSGRDSVGLEPRQLVLRFLTLFLI